MTAAAAVAEASAAVVVDPVIHQWCVRTRPSILLAAAGHVGRARQLAAASPEGVAAVLGAAAPEVLASREQACGQLVAVRVQERSSNAVDVWAALADATWSQTASAASYLLFGGVAAGVVHPNALLRAFGPPRPAADRPQEGPSASPRPGSWAGWDIAWDVAADAVATIAWRAVAVDLAPPGAPVWRRPPEQAWVAARDAVIEAVAPTLVRLEASLSDATKRRRR